MRTGRIEANIVVLNEDFKLPYISDLISQKVETSEHHILSDLDLNFYSDEYARLRRVLDEESQKTTLPEVPSARAALNDLLTRVRLK
jgi:uncharacterized protein